MPRLLTFGLVSLAAALSIAGCRVPDASSAASSGATPASGPALAAYFDCVRERGIAVSAHRGQSADDQPENSLKAIRATGRAIPGVVLELDAVLTRDGQLVLMHDETLDRTTTGRGRVADLTLPQIQQARLTAPDGSTTDEAPPTLAQALAEAGRVGAIANIDLKAADEASTLVLARAVIDEVRRVGAGGRTMLITYSASGARAISAIAPEMMIAATINSPRDLDGLDRTRIIAWTGNRQARPDLWRALRTTGVEPQFGTLGNPHFSLDGLYARDGSVDEYRDLYDQGVVMIATDTPLAVRSVLGPELAAAAQCPRPR